MYLWFHCRQDDIGFELYETKDLFLQLLPPTCIIIMTVIQVQHFHKRLIVSIQSLRLRTFSKPAPKPPEITQRVKRTRWNTIKGIGKSFWSCIIYPFQVLMPILGKNKAMLWNLLEFHWLKLVYISAFASCVRDVSLEEIGD